MHLSGIVVILIVLFVAAAGTIAMLVPLTLMILARRYLMSGLTFGVIREK